MTSELYAPRDYFGEITGTFSDLPQKIPTIEGSLDRYFEMHFTDIIEEWGLLTDRDLQDLDRRLATLSGEIDRLSTVRASLNARVKGLTDDIATLEVAHGR